MIIDLNLKGKQVVVVGGGKEAARKVAALLSQDCQILVTAESVCPEIRGWAKEGKIALWETRIEDGGFLEGISDLILVLSVTEDTELNRAIVGSAKKLGTYAYSADDPEYSDFSHPAVINLHDTVQIAVSTGGKSPLMAKKIREQAEEVFKRLVQKEDLLQIQLQEKIRKAAKTSLPTQEVRKRLLEEIMHDPQIASLLKEDKLEEAEARAMNRLRNFNPGG